MTVTEHADWWPVEEAFRQYRTLVEASDGAHSGPPDRTAGNLAYLLGRTFTHYDGSEEAFIKDLFEVWCPIFGVEADADGFVAMYQDKEVQKLHPYSTQAFRQRPTPFEASVETARRLLTTNEIRDACADLQSGAILGGSASYGRFFNTKGGTNDPSDLDLLLVLPDLAESVRTLAESIREVNGISSEDLDKLVERAGHTDEVRTDLEHMTMSHKVRFWTDGPDPLLEPYQISSRFELQLHMVSWTDFQYLVLDDLPSIEIAKEGEAFDRTMWDFRDDEGRRGTSSTEYSFAAIPYKHNREMKKIDQGYLAEETVCRIENDRFCPGVFHNLVMPQFEVRWDHASYNLRLAVLGFRVKMLERLTRERQLRPWEDQTLAHSHIRGRVFSPHVWRKALNSSGHLT